VYPSARANRKSSSEGLRGIVTVYVLPVFGMIGQAFVGTPWGGKLGEDKAYTLKYLNSFSVAFSRDKSDSYYTTQDTEVY